MKLAKSAQEEKSMNVNIAMIDKYVDKYKTLYLEQFGTVPTSWFSFLRWIASFTSAGSFTQYECNYADIKLNGGNNPCAN